MNMTISASNYFSNIHQNTRTTGEEKQVQKGAAVDAGKTQRSSEYASLDQVNMGQDGVVITEVSRQQGTERSTTQKRSAAPCMDTVEISEEGRRAASAQLQRQQPETAAAEAEQYEAEDLSKYSDTELRQMYYKGEITRREYEDETGETPN